MDEPKPEPPWMRLPRYMLSPAEIEALREDASEASAYFRKAFAHFRPKPKDDTPTT